MLTVYSLPHNAIVLLIQMFIFRFNVDLIKRMHSSAVKLNCQNFSTCRFHLLPIFNNIKQRNEISHCIINFAYRTLTIK